MKLTTILLPLLLASPLPASGGSLFLGGGPAGSAQHGFHGGWGLALGAELPVAPSVSAVFRIDHHNLPDGGGGEYVILPLDVAVLGVGPSPTRVTLRSLMAGIRVHPPHGRILTYADVLIGVGHLNFHRRADPDFRDETNLGFSFGAGVALRASSLARIFADAHLDYYLVEGMVSPIAPIRIGVAVP